MTSQVAPASRPAGQAMAIIAPKKVATPLPPLKRSQTGKRWPTKAAPAGQRLRRRRYAKNQPGQATRASAPLPPSPSSVIARQVAAAGAQHVGRADAARADLAQVARAAQPRGDHPERDRAQEIAEHQAADGDRDERAGGEHSVTLGERRRAGKVTLAFNAQPGRGSCRGRRARGRRPAPARSATTRRRRRAVSGASERQSRMAPSSANQVSATQCCGTEKLGFVAAWAASASASAGGAASCRHARLSGLSQGPRASASCGGAAGAPEPASAASTTASPRPHCGNFICEPSATA